MIIRTSSVLACTALLLSACASTPAVNPDPNHTHADFAVWVADKQIDFSKAEYMSGSSTDQAHDNARHKHLHLHDGNGRVIHRHKPGLTLGEFFASIGYGIAPMRDRWCWYKGERFSSCQSRSIALYVNGKRMPGNPAEYVFHDTDSILITDADTDSMITYQLGLLSKDACLYSRTCPERGEPPTENCVADPEVPCVQ